MLDHEEDDVVREVQDIDDVIPSPWEFIIIHHTEAPSGRRWDGEVSDQHYGEFIDTYHRVNNGWRCMGYHFLIETDGTIQASERWPAWGESWFPQEFVGAHCIPRNRDGIGIGMVGNFDKFHPTLPQYMSLFNLTKRLMVAYAIPPENIQPHRDYSIKTCPGKNLGTTWFDRFRNSLTEQESYWKIGCAYDG